MRLPSLAGRWPLLARVACDATLILLFTVMLRIALQATAGLQWPFDPDQYRDIAQAQTARDGHPLADPAYAGEWIWYNPLLPWLVALGSALTRTDTSQFHVQTGPWLNLAVPIGLYLVTTRVASRAAAVLAVTFFLFWTGGNEPPWAVSIYSPWLFAGAFAQSLFCAVVLVALALDDQVTRWRIVGAGVLLGITFLAHTASAIVAGLVLLAVLCRATLAARATWRHVVAVYALALVVSAPYLWSILLHYHLHVYNAAPMTWRYLPVTHEGWPRLWALQWKAIALLSIVGLVWTIWSRPQARVVIVAWFGASVGMVVYGIVRELVPAWPAIVPTFHFWIYVTLLESLLAGVGAWALIDALVRHRQAAATAIVLLCAAALTYIGAPRFAAREDVIDSRDIAMRRDPNFRLATRFLNKRTPLNDVVLGTHGAANLIIGPAGRKTVAVHPTSSNPYVPYEPRGRDRDAMLSALEQGRPEDFMRINPQYRVTTVVGVGAGQCNGFSTSALLAPLYSFGEVCIFSVKPAE